jgi:CheY-like chemotaxis protein
LLDYLLPRLDGLGVLQAATADAQLARRYRFIIMTAHGRSLPAVLRDISAARQIPLVAKPFALDTLLGAVAVAMRQLDAS